MACVLACVLGSQCRVCFETLGAHEARLWLRKLKSRARLQSRRAYPVSLTEQAKRHAPVAFEVVAEVGSIHSPQRGGERVGGSVPCCNGFDCDHNLVGIWSAATRKINGHGLFKKCMPTVIMPTVMMYTLWNPRESTPRIPSCAAAEAR